MKLMRTEDAAGQVLCHDITQIIKGVTKDAVFRKGHIIQPEDIPVLLSVKKEHFRYLPGQTKYKEFPGNRFRSGNCFSLPALPGTWHEGL